jgi:hypothetical protein
VKNIVKVIAKFIKKGIQHNRIKWGEMERKEKHFLLPMQKTGVNMQNGGPL